MKEWIKPTKNDNHVTTLIAGINPAELLYSQPKIRQQQQIEKAIYL